MTNCFLARLLLLWLCVALTRADGAQRVELELRNRHSSTVSVAWLDPASVDVDLAQIPSASTHSLNTYAGHKFRVRVAHSADAPAALEFEVPHDAAMSAMVVTVVPGASQLMIDVRKAPTLARKSGAAAVVNAVISPKPETEPVEQVMREFCKPTPAEWLRLAERIEAHKAAVLGRKHNEDRRNYLNRVQPGVVPTFTKIGFEKTTVPEPLWSHVMAFWSANKHHTVNENWDLGNSYVNHWEIAPSMCYMPQRLKDEVFRALQPMIEKWANVSEAEPTACYGVRLYHRNAKLENHVDRLDTHALSAIINVDQVVEDDWPLHIYDHDEMLHKVYLKPRDMLFYESASRIHGRPEPFNGTFYANFFVHFRPRHNWVNIDL